MLTISKSNLYFVLVGWLTVKNNNQKLLTNHRLDIVKKSLINAITFFLLILFGFAACNVSESYIITNQSNLRIVERQDHQKCISQGFDLGEWDDISTEMYWRCRYNFAQERMIAEPINADTIRNNAQIGIISEEILKKLNHAKQANLSKIEDDIQTLDHIKCVKQGYNLDDINRLGINEYYLCRQKLVLDRIPPAPALTNSYEASILDKNKFKQYLQDVSANKKTNEEVLFKEAMMNKYPICADLKVDGDDFKKCADAQEESKRCLASIEAKRSKKQLEDKIYCQNQAFVQFPDDYSLTKEKSLAEIAKMKLKQKELDDEQRKERQKNLTLKFLTGGLSNDLGTNDQENSTDNSTVKNKSTEKLYTKIELLKLREQFINRCNAIRDDKLPEFVEKVNNDCLKIATDWDKEI